MGASRFVSSCSGILLQLMRARRPSPRLFLATRVTGGPGGITRPGRWVSGRESRHLPPVEAGAETPVVVQDAKVLVAGRKGVRPPPCSMGPGRAEISLR